MQTFRNEPTTQPNRKTMIYEIMSCIYQRKSRQSVTVTKLVSSIKFIGFIEFIEFFEFYNPRNHVNQRNCVNPVTVFRLPIRASLPSSLNRFHDTSFVTVYRYPLTTLCVISRITWGITHTTCVTFEKALSAPPYAHIHGM